MKIYTLFVAALFVAAMAFSQSDVLYANEGAASAVAASEIESHSVIVSLKKLDAKIPGGLSTWALMTIGFLIELLVRFLPTKKPRSILLLVAAGLNILGSIFTKSSALLDTVAQKVKDK